MGTSPPFRDEGPGDHFPGPLVGLEGLDLVGLDLSAAALYPVDICSGEAQAHTDLVGRQLDLGAVLAFVGLQLRCSRRPVTTTRMPLVRLRATFSARSRQQMTSKNDVTPATPGWSGPASAG